MQTWVTFAVRLALVLWLLFAALSASAQEETDPGAHDVKPGETISKVLDRSIQTAPDTACPAWGRSLSLTPLDGAAHWGCLAVTNTGDRPGVWRLDLLDTAGHGLIVYIDRGEDRRRILNAPHWRTMAMTDGRMPWFASLPFAIAAGETVTLRTELSPSVRLTMDDSLFWAQLVPEQAFDDEKTWQGFAMASLFSTSLLLVLFFVTFARLLNSRPARIYALYFTMATMHFVTQAAMPAWIFPHIPVVAVALTSRIFEIALFLFYYQFVAAFVREALGEHRVVRMLGPAIWAAVGLFLSGLVMIFLMATLLAMPDRWFDPLEAMGLIPGWLITFAIWVTDSLADMTWLALGVLSSVYALWAVSVLIRARADGAGFFALGVGVIVVLYFLPYVQELFGIPRTQSLMLTRGMIVADGIVFAAALISQTFGLRAQRDAAVEAELAASQERLALAEGLLAAQSDRDKARALAERHRARLALTSHDLRQPLASLRLALDAAEREAPQLRERLSSSLDYLRGVLDEALAEARPTDHDTSQAPAPVSEPVPLAMILSNATRMFAGEAEAKGLVLTAGNAPLEVEADPIALIRSLSNLTSNAIKYTRAGQVTLSAIAASDGAKITVTDSGPGLTPAEIAAIRQEYTRGGHGGDGEGLGLTSVQRIAMAQGWRLEIESTPGQGSRFALAGIPIRAPDRQR